MRMEREIAGCSDMTCPKWWRCYKDSKKCELCKICDRMSTDFLTECDDAIIGCTSGEPAPSCPPLSDIVKVRHNAWSDQSLLGSSVRTRSCGDDWITCEYKIDEGFLKAYWQAANSSCIMFIEGISLVALLVIATILMASFRNDILSCLKSVFDKLVNFKLPLQVPERPVTTNSEGNRFRSFEYYHTPGPYTDSTIFYYPSSTGAPEREQVENTCPETSAGEETFHSSSGFVEGNPSSKITQWTPLIGMSTETDVKRVDYPVENSDSDELDLELTLSEV
ncbi:hypothetical protein CAPTEDRAFT_191407 [Capitella teleta]|uniref:Uncharacterized protein n=1 Tax=Capitella teleta TaxID=283909 RepID=R7TQY6_CAPTE|nr:hypothetical protein CAPTEDRAFT_191407 [Capitella teleta]|eukprot:ELT93450.1 hypothetical protein CAPTEDRAFT_191407 [Capitella teleta]